MPLFHVQCGHIFHSHHILLNPHRKDQSLTTTDVGQWTACGSARTTRFRWIMRYPPSVCREQLLERISTFRVQRMWCSSKKRNHIHPTLTDTNIFLVNLIVVYCCGKLTKILRVKRGRYSPVRNVTSADHTSDLVAFVHSVSSTQDPIHPIVFLRPESNDASTVGRNVPCARIRGICRRLLGFTQVCESS